MRIKRTEPLRHRHHLDEELGWIDCFFLMHERDKHSLNRRMFNEDFARLFGSASRRNGNLFGIVSNNDELTKRLLSNVQTRHGPHPIDETVRRWVEDIAETLICSGAAYYYLNGDAEEGDIRINSFGTNGVMRFFGTHIQWIPKRTVRHWNRDDEKIPREIRILHSTKVIRVVMPKVIKRMLSAQNKILATLDRHQFSVSNFQPEATHDNPNPTNHFDFSIWRDIQERALYRSTRATGWNGRKYDSSKRSDFFDSNRLIRFRRNQYILRDEILKQLSAELSRVGNRYNAEFRVEISATDELPSIERLNELEARLNREEVGFSQIVDYCFNR
jgi:hypothetical protein